MTDMPSEVRGIIRGLRHVTKDDGVDGRASWKLLDGRTRCDATKLVSGQVLELATVRAKSRALAVKE